MGSRNDRNDKTENMITVYIVIEETVNSENSNIVYVYVSLPMATKKAKELNDLSIDTIYRIEKHDVIL